MAPTRRATRRVPSTASSDPQPVRERLLDAAMELVRTQGLQGFSQARVAAAAGLRQSHLTYYFPTRKDLLKALVETIHAELKQEVGTLLADDRPSPVSVDTVCEFFGSRLGNPLLARLVVALMNAADEDPSLRRWLVHLDDDLIAQLSEIFDKVGVRPGQDALTLLHTNFIGIAMMAAHDDREDRLARAAHLSRVAIDNLVRFGEQPKPKRKRAAGRRKSGP